MLWVARRRRLDVRGRLYCWIQEQAAAAVAARGGLGPGRSPYLGRARIITAGRYLTRGDNGSGTAPRLTAIELKLCEQLAPGVTTANHPQEGRGRWTEMELLAVENEQLTGELHSLHFNDNQTASLYFPVDRNA